MEEFTLDGITFVNPDACTFGDYGGAGSVGRANIDIILERIESEKMECKLISYGQLPQGDTTLEKEKSAHNWEGLLGTGGYTLWEDNDILPDAFLVSCGYGSETLYLREDKFEDEISALADYPCLDDEKVSEVEIQWEEEAFDSWAKDDLIRDLPDDLLGKLTRLKDAGAQVIWECYRDAMDKCNEYPTPEYSSSHIPTDRIEDTFTALLTVRL